MLVSLPTGSGKSSCYCLLSRAFDFLRKRAALRGSIASSRLCHGPHNFETRRNTSGNLSALPETSATTCFKGGKTNSPEELNTFLRYDGLRKMSQQLNTLLADAIVRFRLILETMLWRSYDSLVKTARSRVRLHSFYAQNLSKYTRRIFPLPLFSARANTSVRRYIDFLILLIPTPLVSVLFAAASLLFVHLRYIDFLILLIPTPLVSVLFAASRRPAFKRARFTTGP